MDAKLSTSRNFRRMFLHILSILVIVAMAFPAAVSASAQDEPTPFSLHIRAYIDGYSQLVIQGSHVYWHHIGAAAPGRWLFVNEPTYLNGTEWYPAWPDILDAENRDCNCDSSTFSDLTSALPEDQTFVLNVIQARYHAFVSQQPDAGNGYTLIIDFDDGKPDGAEWYEVELLPGEPSPLQGEHWGTEGIAHANTCDAYGWAQYDDLPGEVPVRILADGDEIARGETYEHWFYFNLWGLLSSYTDHVIHAQAYDKEWQRWVDLAYTPKMLHCVNYDLYILDTRDGTVERLTTLENFGEYNPSWSPDGRKIVHDVADAGSHALYITDIKTHGSSPLPGADGGNDASWSPNGRWIVFDRRWTEDGANLYLLPPAGGTPILVVSNAVNGTWSPDSQRLVFERDGGLWTASAGGGDEKQIIDAGYGPSWSPNGTWIAYDLNGDIYKIRVNKNGAPLGNSIQVIGEPASEGGVTWSQDSKQIAFTSDASGDSDIWQVPAGGGAAVRLVRTNMYGDYDPAFASAGQYIAYESAKMPAQPYIVAFPEWGYIEAQDWPMGDTVRLMIDDPATETKPDYEAEQATYPNDWGTWWAQFNFDYDLKIGDRVTETDGYLTRTYTVRNLALRGASQQADLVTGFADPGAVVYLWAWGRDESYRELVTGQEGTWTADYSNDDFNLETGMCGRAEVRDKIGNRTAIDWCVRSPRIVASESGNWFWTADFFPGLLDISIYESAEEGAALLWHGQRQADRDGFVIVDDHGVDLVPGNYLVVSDGFGQKELVLQPISVNVFDTWSEAMAGTAPAGSEVWAAAGPQEWQERIPVMADPVTGQWLADFRAIGFDITEEMRPWSYAHIYDEDGDANEGSTPPAARLVVQITDNWFRAEQFAPNAELTYWVYDARDGNLILGPETAWTDDYGTVTTDVGADLVQGNFLVVTDGSTTKEIILEPFTFDIADLSSGLLTGTALPSGRAVWLGIGWQNQDIQTVYITSNENGAWTAEFVIPESQDYWWIAAQVFDPDGDASEVRPNQIIP